MLELLLRAGSDPDCAQRITGRRPLYTAALGGMYKIIRILIESGADKDARINLGRGRSGNFTALHAAGDGAGETHGKKFRLRGKTKQASSLHNKAKYLSRKTKAWLSRYVEEMTYIPNSAKTTDLVLDQDRLPLTPFSSSIVLISRSVVARSRVGRSGQRFGTYRKERLSGSAKRRRVDPATSGSQRRGDRHRHDPRQRRGQYR